MRYFQDLNLLLSIALFLFSTCFIILSADGLTNRKIINQLNILCIAIWVIVILIFHPKKAVVDSNKSHHQNTNDTGSSMLCSIEEDEAEYQEHKRLNSHKSNSKK
ncbi:hypothetical protein INT46_003112 [Mucor plumbeus]|uniref:Uncharacterized protein n=1 Tax=Mucor plumbeus TaxID=97098 RepID=A0A8H7R1B8_9FUNG|nr:hypothetical protein INT46_003112 [Mucor plumbeus]